MRLINNDDYYLMFEGKHTNLYEIFGSFINESGVLFSLYAPHAIEVSIMSDFNNWDGSNHNMNKIDDRGIWQLQVNNIFEYTKYKYCIKGIDGNVYIKADPFAMLGELRPSNASIVYEINHFPWTDDIYKNSLNKDSFKESPINIYEAYLGGWHRKSSEEYHSYEYLAHNLIPYLDDMKYTHLEIMPILEHPLDASWGYQATGYFSATHRYGNPKQLMHLVQTAHQYNIGVIYDFVPVHFCKDSHGLYNFDGQEVYGYHDHRLDNKQWGSANFNLEDGYVQSFLISSMIFYFKYYHFDGIRIDAVSYLLYENGNENKENVAGIKFIRNLTEAIKRECPQALIIAEDSSSYKGVTKPHNEDGLGFDLKWNLGWMNDTLKYFELEAIARQYHHQKLNFSYYYMFNENYILPLSHDEVVHNKKNIIDKITGSYDDKFKQARLLYAHMYTHPGKKLNFMGNEIASFREFDEDKQLDWFLLDYSNHKSFKHYIRTLNNFYKNEPCLFTGDYHCNGFTWMFQNEKENIIAFSRNDIYSKRSLYIVHNFSGATYAKWYLGIPKGKYKIILASEWEEFGGKLINNNNIIVSISGNIHNYNNYIVLDLLPFSSLILENIL